MRRDATTPRTSTSNGPPEQHNEQNTLEQAAMQWHFGDWENLVEIDAHTLERSRDRARLALMIATAHLQLGNHTEGRRLVEQARQWGSSRKAIARFLIAGVHNTLAVSHALMRDQEGAIRHFKLAVCDTELAYKARAIHEVTRLGLRAESRPPQNSYSGQGRVGALLHKNSANPIAVHETTNQLQAFGLMQMQQMCEQFAGLARQQHDDLWGAVRHVEGAVKTQLTNATQQMEASLNIQAYLRDGTIPGQMHGWPISPDFAYLLIQLIERNDYDLIIEFGSGTSTVLIARALGNTNKRRPEGATAQVAFEHLEKYYSQTHTDLTRAGLANVVSLVLAPLKPYLAPTGEKYSYYDCGRTLASLAKEAPQRHKLLLVVDGPPGGTGKNARYPALPVTLEHFPGSDVHILLDDYRRSDEKDTASLWGNELAQLGRAPDVSEYKLEKGACLIQAPATTNRSG